VKVFQAISLNNNIIDNTMNNELLSYTDSAPYDANDIDCESIQQFKSKYRLIQNESMNPINSGMISLVYKMLKIGTSEEVVVKIKRKNIDNKLDDAINKLLFFVDLISYIPKFNTLNIPHTIKKNISLLKEQLDFKKEIQNTLEMKEVCKNLKYIVIPNIYTDVTDDFPNIIMMDYIKGQHISEVNKDDYKEYAKLVLKYGFISTIIFGVTHGDLHQGNILFIKNDFSYKFKNVFQLGIIDFGIVTRINDKMKNVFLELVPEMFNDCSKNMAEKLLNTLIEPEDILQKISKEDAKKLVEDTGKLIKETIHITKDSPQLKIYEFIEKFNKYIKNNNKYNFYLNDDFMKLQMAMAMSHSVSMHLCDNDYMEFANKVINELFHIDLLTND